MLAINFQPKVVEIESPRELSRNESTIRVLVVEDDISLRTLIADYLERNGVIVTTASSAVDIARRLSSSAPDLILLDLQLGLEDGLDILRTVRAAHNTPVIIMTGHRSDEVDRVVGLELGADDYLLKPLSLRELLARIRTVLRRGAVATKAIRREREAGISRFGSCTLNRKTRQLFDGGGRPIPLTKGEYALLTVFIDYPRQILSREQLLVATHVHEDIQDRSIDVQILRLRRKLETDPSSPKIIRTERGAGYIFDIDVERVRRG